jgi:hypothetical protein
LFLLAVDKLSFLHLGPSHPFIQPSVPPNWSSIFHIKLQTFHYSISLSFITPIPQLKAFPSICSNLRRNLSVSFHNPTHILSPACQHPFNTLPTFFRISSFHNFVYILSPACLHTSLFLSAPYLHSFTVPSTSFNHPALILILSPLSTSFHHLVLILSTIPATSFYYSTVTLPPFPLHPFTTLPSSFPHSGYTLSSPYLRPFTIPLKLFIIL